MSRNFKGWEGFDPAEHALRTGTSKPAVMPSQAVKKHKYSAISVVIDEIRFDSKKEGRYYEELKMRVLGGEVSHFLRQVPLHLPGGTVMRIDFLEFWTDGSVHYVDVKGYQTQTFKVKKREVEHHYPITIETP